MRLEVKREIHPTWDIVSDLDALSRSAEACTKLRLHSSIEQFVGDVITVFPVPHLRARLEIPPQMGRAAGTKPGS